MSADTEQRELLQAAATLDKVARGLVVRANRLRSTIGLPAVVWPPGARSVDITAVYLAGTVTAGGAPELTE